MSKQIPFIHRRGDIFHYRISVPFELREITGCREMTMSLRTSDRLIAQPIALELAAISKRLFFDLRKIMANSNSKLDMIIRMKVAQEEIKRRWLKEEQEAEIDRLQEVRRQELRVLNAKIDVYKEIYSGIQLPNQHLPNTSLNDIKEEEKIAQTVLHKLSEIIPFWISIQNPAKSSIVAFKFVVDKFEKLNPTLSIENTKFEDVKDFVKALQDDNLSPRTVSKDISFIRALFGIAIGEKWIKSNPAVGHKLPLNKSKQSVRGYRVEEINGIFSSPVFSNNLRPNGCKGDAAFWIPLLLLFTGARREEICQLTTNRIRKENNINVLDINTIDEDDTLKTASSVRIIPIHSFLIKLGFLDFVKKIEESNNGNSMLFPLLAQNARGHYGQKWGDWWGKYIKQTVGITDSLISPAHSFRHSFITECRRAHISGDISRIITGHTGRKKDDHDNYGETPIETLANAINKINYPGIKLDHLIPANLNISK